MRLVKAVKNRINSIGYRIYSDFCMPSRLSVYENLLEDALSRGYETYSVYSFSDHIQTMGLDNKRKYLILRHDIDTDIATAKEMWNIEQQLGVQSSYYFRISTIDPAFMQLIHQSGSEASYHYEEIASYCKLHKIKNPDEVRKNIAHIRSKFIENYSHIKKQTGLPMKTVASHGDFVNRKLGITNSEILEEGSLREELGIESEVYDETVMKYVTSRYSDAPAPNFWKQENPKHSFERNDHIVYILTHPRHWRKNIPENIADNVNRLWEGFRYHLGW